MHTKSQYSLIPLHSLWLFVGGVVLLTSACVCALENGLGRTPPMGWNPWNKFGTRVTEAIVREITDSMKSKGLLAAGYEYVCVDGGGSYPSGKKALADYLHARGFKFGDYANDDRGVPDETALANHLIAVGADYLKYDCYKTPITHPTWIKMRDAILATKRPIFYAIHTSTSLSGLSSSGKDSLKLIANMWRVSGDITIDFRSIFWNADCSNILHYLQAPAIGMIPTCYRWAMAIRWGWADIRLRKTEPTLVYGVFLLLH